MQFNILEPDVRFYLILYDRWKFPTRKMIVRADDFECESSRVVFGTACESLYGHERMVCNLIQHGLASHGLFDFAWYDLFSFHGIDSRPDTYTYYDVSEVWDLV